MLKDLKKKQILKKAVRKAEKNDGKGAANIVQTSRSSQIAPAALKMQSFPNVRSGIPGAKIVVAPASLMPRTNKMTPLDVIKGRGIQLSEQNQEIASGRKGPTLTDNLRGAVDKANILSGKPTNYNMSRVTKIPEGWDVQTYKNFKVANPTLEPTVEDTRRMQNAGTPAENKAYMNSFRPRVRIINSNPVRIRK